MIEVDNLNFSYDKKNNTLENVNFKIQEGYVYCLLGENGTGKTTLFRCLSGELKCNLDFSKYKNDILFIHDKMDFYNHLTGEEYVNLIMYLKNRKLNEKYFKEMQKRLDMDRKIDSKIFSYSLGMKHKLLLMLALLLDYKYILIDEPFTALDFMSTEIVEEIVKEYARKGNAIVISTHLMDVAQEISDKILLLSRGKITEVDNNFNSSKELKDRLREVWS
ncbi:MAG: ATP-binding cassette domain-containing protein [Clostridium sp.]|jgi:ABC-2 type transport system ATP-binding protein|nr:ABC transporter ATP-binding protein [Clostridium sp.]